jgi:hypothetical protein
MANRLSGEHGGAGCSELRISHSVVAFEQIELQR